MTIDQLQIEIEALPNEESSRFSRDQNSKDI